VKQVILITKGLIRDRQMRRVTMFGVAIGAMLMVFFGSVFQGSKDDNPWLFICYWLSCAWLTVLLLLLSLYDLIALRLKMAAEQKKLKSEILDASVPGRKDQ
jgi:hypothetical protein